MSRRRKYRNMAKQGFKITLTTSALSLLLIGCGTATSNNSSNAGNTSASNSNSSNKPNEGGAITLDFEQQIRDLDPAKSFDSQSAEVVKQMYDRLVTWNSTTTKIVPMGATKWTVSPDGLTYTFHIRQGMTFWNGDPVTAQSYAYEIERILTKSVASPVSQFLGDIKGSTAFYDGKASSLSGVTTPSKDTLVVQLKKPQKFFLQIMAMPQVSAVDQKFINKVGNKAFNTREAMGSGPFELKSISPNQIVLVKNPHYWMKDSSGQSMPYLNQVTINISSNGQLDAEHFQKGQTAWLGWNMLGGGIPSASYPQFLANPTLKSTIKSKVQNAVNYLGLNFNMSPTNNLDFRKAIEYAIDKKRIIQLNAGRGQIANQPLPPGIPGYVQQLNANAVYTYDPAKARQYLKKSGLVNPSVVLYSSNGQTQLKEDAAIQSMLQAVGITCTIHTSSWSTFLNLAAAGKADFYWLAWIQDFPDASDFLNTLFNSKEAPTNNNGMYSNSTVDKWLNLAEYDNSQSQRLSLYTQATNQIMADAAWVPLYYNVLTFAVQPWVHGFYVDGLAGDPMVSVWLSKSHLG